MDAWYDYTDNKLPVNITSIIIPSLMGSSSFNGVKVLVIASCL